ncbi:hypothetical protein L7F22_021348 [Adiantum nelumboides]|nr:hypothetical protein [Adiantum nelumboides]
MVCRNKERGEDAVSKIKSETGNESVHLKVCDLSSLDQIKHCANDFRTSNSPLHVLVNNAGLMEHERVITADGLELNFAVNVVGVYAMTEMLSPLLKKAAPEARVITVSSGGMYTSSLTNDLQFEEGKFDGTVQYARNKRIQFSFMKDLDDIVSSKYTSLEESLQQEVQSKPRLAVNKESKGIKKKPHKKNHHKQNTFLSRDKDVKLVSFNEWCDNDKALAFIRQFEMAFAEGNFKERFKPCHVDSFADELPDKLPRSRPEDHTIDLIPGSSPPNQPLYRVALTEKWAEDLKGTGVSFYSMHPGWADTPAVAKSMPQFKSMVQNRLRTPEQGADTVVWLATQPNGKLNSGSFYFDRMEARKHLPLCGTAHTPQLLNSIVESLKSICKISV